jgi:hypothetical protein
MCSSSGRIARVSGTSERDEGRGARGEGRGTRDEGQGARVEGRGARVEGRGARGEGRGTRLGNRAAGSPARRACLPAQPAVGSRPQGPLVLWQPSIDGWHARGICSAGMHAHATANILHRMCNMLPELVFHVSPVRGELNSSPGRKAGVDGGNQPPSFLLPRGSPVGAIERRSVAPTGLQKEEIGRARAFPGLAPGARD